ncbi:TPA: hypothetical protein VU243_001726 [Streptococcus pneumoniae]|nr:hypothetical protein [Streptococcus pneumoniae]
MKSAELGIAFCAKEVLKKETLEKWRLKSAELGIAFCAKEVLKKEIPHHVDKRDFLEVLPLIDRLE